MLKFQPGTLELWKLWEMSYYNNLYLQVVSRMFTFNRRIWVGSLEWTKKPLRYGSNIPCKTNTIIKNKKSLLVDLAVEREIQFSCSEGGV